MVLAACKGLLDDDDLRRIEDAAYRELSGAEDGEHFIEVDLARCRTFFGTVELTTWGHVETGAEFMGQYERIGVTDAVRVEFTSAELWYDIDGDGRTRDVLDQMQEIEKDVEGMLL